MSCNRHSRDSCETFWQRAWCFQHFIGIKITFRRTYSLERQQQKWLVFKWAACVYILTWRLLGEAHVFSTTILNHTCHSDPKSWSSIPSWRYSSGVYNDRDMQSFNRIQVTRLILWFRNTSSN